MFDIINGFRSILNACDVVKPGERILVIADNEGQSMWLGQLLMNLISSMGAEAVLMVINPPEMRGADPSATVAAAMKSANVSIRVTDEKAALVHSTARKEATALGARYCLFDSIPIEHIIKGASVEDIRAVAERTENMAKLLDQTKVAKVTTPAGTNITVRLAGRKAIPLHPLSPVVAGMPYYAEAASAPIEGTAEGIIVVDLGFIDWGYILNKPVYLTVKEGVVVAIEGAKQETDRLNAALLKYKNAGNIAEFGIGTSHIVPLPMRGTRQDAARLGTMHFALGRNNDIGGNTLSEVHWDVLIDQPTVELDGRCILEDGNLNI